MSQYFYKFEIQNLRIDNKNFNNILKTKFNSDLSEMITEQIVKSVYTKACGKVLIAGGYGVL